MRDAFFIVEPNHEQRVDIAKRLDAGELRAFVKGIIPLNRAAEAYGGAATLETGHGKS